MAKKVRIELDYDIGDEVYLKTDLGGLKRIVVGITLLPGNLAMYTLACSDNEVTDHYPIEISDVKAVE